MRKYVYTKSEAVTVERYLLDSACLTPRSELKRAFTEKKIRINGKPVTRSNLLAENDIITVDSEAVFGKDELRIRPNKDIFLKTVSIQKDYVIVDKPHGMHAHPQNPNEHDTALNAIIAQFPECQTAFNPERPLEGGLVHRLDSGTSGLLVCARTQAGFTSLKKAWGDDQFFKIYLALVEGDCRVRGRIELSLEHDPKSGKRMRVCPDDSHGNRSVTSIAPLEHFKDKRVNVKGATLVIIRIHTGLMHQIRVVMAALGHAVVGDRIYRSSDNPRKISVRHLDQATASEFDKVVNESGIKSEVFDPDCVGEGFCLRAHYLRLPAL